MNRPPRFAEVQALDGLIFRSVSVYEHNGNCWASPASKPQIEKDGAGLRDRHGKIRHARVFAFASKELHDIVSDAVIAARPTVLS